MRIVPIGILVLVCIVALYEHHQSKSVDLRIAALIDSIQTRIAAADPSKDAYYDSQYRAEESTYWAKIPRWIVEDAELRRLVDGDTVVEILDIGCGYGTLLAFATSAYAGRGLCLDIVPFLRADIQQTYAINYLEMDVEKSPFPFDLEADIVLMTEVIEHLNFHPRHTLAKIYSALKPGGSFFLSTPDAENGWGRVVDYYGSIDEMPAPDPDKPWIDGHIWQYNATEIRTVLEAAGFEIRRFTRTPGIVGEHFNIWAAKPRF